MEKDDLWTHFVYFLAKKESFPTATEQNGGLHVMTVYILEPISW